ATKSVATELITSQMLLNHIIDAIPEPIFVKDELHRWVALNEACCKLMGYRRDELIGKSDYDFFPQEEADVFWEKDNLVFSTGQPHENEENFTDAQGQTYLICTKKSVVQDGRGQKLLVGTIRDVSAHRQAQEQLRETEQFIRSIYEGVEKSIFVVDVWEQGKFRYVSLNPAHERLTGIRSEELG
ncbi:MAG TPA: histidine kinase, partial [Cyanobacteria bacterium UBA12227]|nr:histidine kinase [Cyanobacteria bacterium UBA12227]